MEIKKIFESLISFSFKNVFSIPSSSRFLNLPRKRKKERDKKNFLIFTTPPECRVPSPVTQQR